MKTPQLRIPTGRRSPLSFLDDYDRAKRNEAKIRANLRKAPIRVGLAAVATVGAELIDRARADEDGRSKAAKALLAYASVQVIAVAAEGAQSFVLHYQNGQLEAAAQARLEPVDPLVASQPVDHGVNA